MSDHDFKPGDAVIYQPHPDAIREYGTVARTNDSYVFVQYDGDRTPKATRREDLWPQFIERR